MSITWARMPSTRSGVRSAAQDARYSASSTSSSVADSRAVRRAASVAFRAVGDFVRIVSAACFAAWCPQAKRRSTISSTESAA